MKKTMAPNAVLIQLSLLFCACMIPNIGSAQSGIGDLSYFGPKAAEPTQNDIWFNKCSEDGKANVKKCTEDGAKACAGKIGNATQGSSGALCECMNNQLSYCLERFCKNQKPDNY